ncbi:MAG TPA: cytochrome P450 [Thermoanaerobaculia bacterium]|nr:cytochrome P450 [Thermoanaerobaculia bacterium]
MPDRASAERFLREPLEFLDHAFPAAGEALLLPGRQLCVAAPGASRAILANDGGLYQEHSDFFHTSRGPFGPRSLQIEIGRAARALLRTHITQFAGELPGKVRRALVPTSDWPDAGNYLVYRHFAAALASPDSPLRFQRTLDQIVERSVLAGSRQRGLRIARALYQSRALRELAKAIETRRQHATAQAGAASESTHRNGARQPADLLDVVAAAGPPATAAELAEIFVSFLFAIAGSVGFVLGWSLYLLGTNPPTDAEPAWVVREALRLWPVAWLLGRRPARPHKVAGESVTPDDQVVVCPYLVHRDARHWEDPHSFRPERWAAVDDHHAFLPFGWGPHRCVAAALAMQVVEDIVRIVVDEYRLTVTPLDGRPCVGPALAPPRFTLDLCPRTTA